MTGHLIAANGVELWVELDGDGAETPVVLLGGADASVLRWPSQLVDGLVQSGHRVVRLEHRDTGWSTWMSPDEPYRLEDLARDTQAVLDALELGSVHLVGYSMGGAVAQLVAMAHPERVRTLTLIATTPGAGDERLAGPDPDFVERMAERLLGPQPQTHQDRVRFTVDLYRLLAGDRYPFDEHGHRALADAEIRRAWRPESGHGIAVGASPSRLDRLASITSPTLVLHGTRDPVYPLVHGELLAAGIPAARFVAVEGLGHEVPAAWSEELLAELRGHLGPR